MGKAFYLASALALISTTAEAQVITANFYGTVTDPTGAVVPAATVTLIHEDTGTIATRKSSSAGEFGFDYLRVGAYTLRIEAQGFKRYESKNIALAAGQTIRESFNIELGS